MKTIEITTSQNVTIQYHLAAVWDRIIAFAIDATIITLTSLMFMGIMSLVFPRDVDLVAYLTIVPFILLYSVCFEVFNHGQSPGKMILKLRVIRMDGERTNFLDYLMRWTFRALDIYASFGTIAILSIISSANNQRLGDLLANTIVVNVSKIERMRLENLLKLNKIGNYKITYPQVAKMPEEAMLIVKETLAKQFELKNEAHDEALALLVTKMQKELKVKAPEDKQLFLSTLLKDYIILTR